jgi:hypothetical protein
LSRQRRTPLNGGCGRPHDTPSSANIFHQPLTFLCRLASGQLENFRQSHGCTSDPLRPRDLGRSDLQSTEAPAFACPQRPLAPAPICTSLQLAQRSRRSVPRCGPAWRLIGSFRMADLLPTSLKCRRGAGTNFPRRCGARCTNRPALVFSSGCASASRHWQFTEGFQHTRFTDAKAIIGGLRGSCHSAHGATSREATR